MVVAGGLREVFEALREGGPTNNEGAGSLCVGDFVGESEDEGIYSSHQQFLCAYISIGHSHLEP